MKLNELQPAHGATHYKKRVGRGSGSGHGATAGKGDKGQNARSGRSVKIGFEGGQMPLMRRLPKRGFTNTRFATMYSVINLDTLATAFADKTEITINDIYVQKLARRGTKIKILGRGECGKKTVAAHRFSESAKQKIVNAGGTVNVFRSKE